MALWITADWHIGETRLETLQRPFKSMDDHIDVLVDRFNSVVSPNDEVVVAGDVIYRDAPKSMLENVSRFNGKKTLVRGNHDRGYTDDELLRYFDKVIGEGDGITLNACGIECWVTHYPSQSRPDLFNLVGHVHSAWKYQLNMLNIGVDVNHFYPININKIPFHYDAICKYYDGDIWIAYSELNSQFFGKRGKNSFYFQK